MLISWLSEVRGDLLSRVEVLAKIVICLLGVMEQRKGRGKKVIITWSKCFVGVLRNYKYAIKINESITFNLYYDYELLFTESAFANAFYAFED